MEVEKEQYACEGTHATLTCEAKDVLKQDTEVTSSWKFKKQEIQPDKDPRYEVNLYRASDSASLELVVFNASLGDSGDYTCVVKNRMGEATGKTRLEVISKDVQPKVAIEGKRIVKTTLGLNVTLLCHVSYPRYMKNARSSWLNVTAGNQRGEVQARAGSLEIVQMSLEIVNVTFQHEGRYVCALNSTEGMHTDQVMLRVTDPNAARHSKAESSRPSSSLTVAVLIISGGTLLTVIGLVLRHRIRRPQTHYHGPTNNTNFKYDVFVTFSGKDSDWVKGNLLPLLDDNSLKYCIHHRDFELGRDINENMAESVYTSKKVLAIVSKNYLTSGFCQSELEMALYRSTKRGDSSLIVIRIDNITKESLPKSLRNRTFLDYHDKIERKTWDERLIKHLVKTTALPIG